MTETLELQIARAFQGLIPAFQEFANTLATTFTQAFQLVGKAIMDSYRVSKVKVYHVFKPPWMKTRAFLGWVKTWSRDLNLGHNFQTRGSRVICSRCYLTPARTPRTDEGDHWPPPHYHSPNSWRKDLRRILMHYGQCNDLTVQKVMDT